MKLLVELNAKPIGGSLAFEVLEMLNTVFQNVVFFLSQSQHIIGVSPVFPSSSAVLSHCMAALGLAYNLARFSFPYSMQAVGGRVRKHESCSQQLMMTLVSLPALLLAY